MTLGYTTIGEGAEPVLVFHSWMSDHTVWSPILPVLDGQTFTYVFPDYRGYGRSRQLKGRYTLTEIAADMIELIEHLGWRRFHVIGHSMGAMAMQRLLVDINDWQRIKSAIAVTPIPASGAQLDESNWAIFEASITDSECRRMILNVITGERLPAAWLDNRVKESYLTTTEEAYASYLKAWVFDDFSASVMGLNTPLLTLVGEHDRAITESSMADTYLKWYPNATLEILGNSGHYPMQETPLAFVAAIERFMKRFVLVPTF
ncbi:alpha/beta fold hydrolase [Thiofilum flexile]|uniref:alpha/beta fold hydrolase n=1 Tax=Thiofilum flexile TaxID=125627 RepID=UPI00036711C8|nr:alpha/beta hydrolase [Thiofilum flexile]